MLKKIFCLMLIMVPCFAGVIDYAPAQIGQWTPGTAYTVNSVLTTTAMQGSPQKPLSSGFTPLELAMQNAYRACVDIDDELTPLKSKAGINTAITSVGTLSGAGATATGFIKSSKDKEYAEIKKELARSTGANASLSELDQENNPSLYPTSDQKKQFKSGLPSAYSAIVQQIEEVRKNQAKGAESEKLAKESKKLGNWRTGLLAGNTATDIAGTVIAATNKVKADLQTQIEDCIGAVSALRSQMMQSRMDGEDIGEAQNIVDACSGYEHIDTSKINKRATGSAVSSGIGGAVGLAGTIVSGTANSDKTDINKKQGLNTAANVMSIGATAASVTATVFNVAQISAIKKVIKVAQECTGALK